MKPRKLKKKIGRPRKPSAERQRKIVGRPRKPKPTERIQKAPIGRPRLPITIINRESKGKTHICENCNSTSLHNLSFGKMIEFTNYSHVDLVVPSTFDASWFSNDCLYYFLQFHNHIHIWLELPCIPCSFLLLFSLIIIMFCIYCFFH